MPIAVNAQWGFCGLGAGDYQGLRLRSVNPCLVYGHSGIVA